MLNLPQRYLLIRVNPLKQEKGGVEGVCRENTRGRCVGKETHTGKKNIFFPLPFRFSIGTLATKGRLTREKHSILFNVSFIWCERLHKEMRTERNGYT